MKSVKSRQQELVALFASAPIAQSMGMTLSYDEEDRAVFQMPYHSGFDHALKGVHGGVFATGTGTFMVLPKVACS